MASTPAAPTPAPAKKSALKTILTDTTVIVGEIVTGGEAILTAFPSGALHTGLVIALPILGSILAGLKNLGG